MRRGKSNEKGVEPLERPEREVNFMPELPEVETIRQDLEKELPGFLIDSVQTTFLPMVKPTLTTVREGIVGKTIKDFKRKGKLLIVNFRNSTKHLLFHLKMTGRLLVRDEKHKQDPFTRVILKLSRNGKSRELRFTDVRKFGFVKVAGEEELKKILAAMGPEPLDDLNLEGFKKILQKSRRPVKVVLMDQGLISGVGNIYANEALFLAKIHPRTQSDKIAVEKVENLYFVLIKVLKEGIKYRGASDNTYRDAHGEKGHFQEHFKVYGRKGEKCLVCGEQIKRIELGQRGTFFCPRCQK
ncbi:DNA-formamidopyrimidine glycosylase [candidate division WWE3 bacterium CG06_land_8_20_14_3_00_42_16]|uniref:DNA-formamidopyrimidine glycosylase n=3 Tax=Katanobacteria TaxID=422282 RepID=A0A2M7AP84_UNCKA|nr:MAG: DNA-formamidopyrimidine glycosylase [candidate division WWE3 bacterium CG06_land_8_20_14_3_00_42_16]PJA38169.1 MAG: DNA-formamidopyrimidine glycosylase [candidate division WWE3 bacterium CG_4_9_14_3_um_filter_43_9]PJC68760.1 MAG: DNA-formamidopyrimidine glycosylase [candidate division WWE3 bacterium CG_4_8_14_3_um_filter_42_11]